MMSASKVETNTQSTTPSEPVQPQITPNDTIPKEATPPITNTPNTNDTKHKEQPNENQTETELATSSITETMETIEIPPQAKQFIFGSQIMIIGLNGRTELNKKLGFVVGDYKKYSQRMPVRLITNDDPSTAPTYLLKMKNLQFVSPPIPGYDVEPYDDHESQDGTDLSESDSDSDSTSSSESSLSNPITNLQAMNIKTDPITMDHPPNDEDDDIKSNPNQFKITHEKLDKVNEKMVKYYEIMAEFNKPETIDLSPSITSTKSLPIDCGLRWEPIPITEDIDNLEIEKIGSIKNIINDIEIVIESVHETQTVITFDSVLCLVDRTPIGRVDDIFGAVKKPYYFVRLTVDRATLLKDKITLSQDVYAVKPLCNYVIPPKTDERYSSESDLSSSDEEYAPNNINTSKKYNKKRSKRAMSVDRENNNNYRNRRQRYKRKYLAGNSPFNHNKRQRYSSPYAQQQQQQTYQPYYYTPFNALPRAIPPSSLTSHAMSTAATFFRPQVNIIPSPPTNYINTMNYNLRTPPQSTAQTLSLTNQQMAIQRVIPQQKSPNISIDPFSFGKKKSK